MFTIHDSRDIGCPVRGIADDRFPAQAHEVARANSIPEQFRIILSHPSLTHHALSKRIEEDSRQLALRYPTPRPTGPMFPETDTITNG